MCHQNARTKVSGSYHIAGRGQGRPSQSGCDSRYASARKQRGRSKIYRTDKLSVEILS